MKAWWQPRERKVLTIGGVKFSIAFEPRDIWVGVFWDRRNGAWQVFVTIVPCFPLRIAWREYELADVEIPATRGVDW